MSEATLNTVVASAVNMSYDMHHEQERRLVSPRPPPPPPAQQQQCMQTIWGSYGTTPHSTYLFPEFHHISLPGWLLQESQLTMMGYYPNFW